MSQRLSKKLYILDRFKFKFFLNIRKMINLERKEAVNHRKEAENIKYKFLETYFKYQIKIKFYFRNFAAINLFCRVLFDIGFLTLPFAFQCSGYALGIIFLIILTIIPRFGLWLLVFFSKHILI